MGASTLMFIPIILLLAGVSVAAFILWFKLRKK